MAENEELKNMEDPNQIGAMNGEEEDGYQEPEVPVNSSTKMEKPQEGETLPTGSALDPNMKVVKNYVRKPAEEAANVEARNERTQICPRCKQSIYRSDWQQHFKMCVMDPKTKEQKQQLIERKANAGYAGADDIT